MRFLGADVDTDSDLEPPEGPADRPVDSQGLCMSDRSVYADTNDLLARGHPIFGLRKHGDQ